MQDVTALISKNDASINFGRQIAIITEEIVVVIFESFHWGRGGGGDVT